MTVHLFFKIHFFSFLLRRKWGVAHKIELRGVTWSDARASPNFIKLLPQYANWDMTRICNLGYDYKSTFAHLIFRVTIFSAIN